MSAAIKLATVASGFTLLSASAMYSMRVPQQDFSKQAQSLDHTAEAVSAPVAKPKLYVCPLSSTQRALC